MTAVDPLEAKGWIKDSIGQFRSNGQIKDKRKRSIYCSTWELAYARTFLDMLRRVIEPGVPIDKDELHALQTVMSHIDYDDLPASLGGKRHGNEDHIASQLFYKTNV